MSNDLNTLFGEQEKVAHWKAEAANATARLELARINEHCAYLLSQHEPVAMLGIDREKLRLVLNYVRHGDLGRLSREFQELRVTIARHANE